MASFNKIISCNVRLLFVVVDRQPKEAETMSEFLCPIHFVALRGVLPGGAGHCAKCGLYVQAHGVPMPTLTPEQIARREATPRKRNKAVLAAKADDSSRSDSESKNANTGNSEQN